MNQRRWIVASLTVLTPLGRTQIAESGITESRSVGLMIELLVRGGCNESWLLTDTIRYVIYSVCFLIV